MKTLAFVFGLCISAVGAIGILAPSGLVWLAQRSVNSGAFYLIAAIQITFGLILISVASTSRVPKALRVLGYVILILGITTALMGLMAIGRAQGAVDWWLQQGSGLVRLTGLVLHIALSNVWNRLNVTTRQVAGDWLKSAEAKEWVKSGSPA